MVAEGTTAAMTAHNGLAADVEGIIEALLASVTEIDKDTQTVHLADDLFTESTHTVVGIISTGRVADIVVAVMAEGDIHHTTIGKVLQVLELAFECQSVLNTQHDTLQSLVLMHPEVVRGTGNRDIVLILTDDLLDLIEDQVGISFRP